MSAATTAAHSAKTVSGGHMNSDKMRQESITMDMLEVRTFYSVVEMVDPIYGSGQSII